MIIYNDYICVCKLYYIIYIFLFRHHFKLQKKEIFCQ